MINSIKGDGLYLFYREMLDQYNAKVAPNVTKYDEAIDQGMQKYMAAQMTVFKDKRFYPDANSTLRITYGNVNGYTPRDAVKYEFQTWLDGVMEKYIPGNYEFDLPQKLIDLYEKGLRPLCRKWQITSLLYCIQSYNRWQWQQSCHRCEWQPDRP